MNIGSPLLCVYLLCVPALSFAETSYATMSLGQAAEKVLRQNKDLQSFSLELRAHDGRMLQADLLPNPQLSVNPENVIGSRFFRQQIQNTVELSQLIELGGKRSKRLGVAEAEKEAALSAYELKRNEILSALNIRFVEVLSDQAMLKLMRRAKLLAEGMLRTVRERVKSGGGAGYEEPRTRVLLARAEIDEEHSEHELLSSKRLLASFWNEEEIDATLSGDLLHLSPLPLLDGLYEKLATSPRVLQSQATQRLKRALLSLEEAKRAPDLTVGVGWRYGRSFDDQAAVASVAIPLQIFDRNQGNIAAASALSSAAAIEMEALPVRMKAAVFELYQELKHARTELELMEREILPQAESALRLLQEGYQLGRYSYTDLREAQSAVIENYAAQTKAALKYHTLSIELNQLLGGPNYDLLP